VNILATVPKSLHSKLGAGEWAKSVSEKFGGKAGGKPESAQGSVDVSKFDDVFNAAIEYVSSKL